jgi:hypothetical protein
MTRSVEPARFHWLPLRSLIPEESVTTIGYCTPAVDPAVTMVGFADIVIERTSLLVLRVHVAFVPQMMSATVFVVPPGHGNGPAFVALPQSLSVTRITALAATDIASLNVNSSLSPVSRVLAKPDDALRSAEVDVGGVESIVPGRFTGT